MVRAVLNQLVTGLLEQGLLPARALRVSLDWIDADRADQGTGIAGMHASGGSARQAGHRALQVCGRVFRYAVATGRAERDPSGDLRGALPPVKEKHHESFTDLSTLAGLLRAIDSYDGSNVVRSALRLAPMVFVRPGELRAAEWRISTERMKLLPNTSCRCRDKRSRSCVT